ncbi:hypothetical protein GF327_02225 [Candidatus Woesearchaeota archaeon]|nr:hypothetical protein [Candidatus Woesearchaeota archaeon]
MNNKLIIFVCILSLVVIPYGLSYEINITLTEPVYGVSKEFVFDLEIYTEQETDECKYSNSPLLNYSEIQAQRNIFQNINNHRHRIEDFEDLKNSENTEKKIYIKCRTITGEINENDSVELTLMVDTTPPEITSAAAVPENVIEKLQTELRVETQDETYCKYDDEFEEYEDMRYTFQNGLSYEKDPYQKGNLLFSHLSTQILEEDTELEIIDKNNYAVYVSCMNRAQDISSTREIDFSVNLEANNLIEEISPSGLVSGDNITLYVRTNKNSVCYYGEEYSNKFPVEHTKEHEITLSDFSSGENQVPVKCVYDLGGVDRFASIEFVWDKNPPEILNIHTTNFTCQTNELSAEFISEDKDISYFEYRISDSENNTIVDWANSDEKVKETGLSLVINNVYYWNVRPVDAAANIGSIKQSKGTAVFSENHTFCRNNTPPKVNISETNTTSGKEISLSCVDDGYCSSKKYFIIYENTTECDRCSNCPMKYYYYPPVITADSVFCYVVSDNDGAQTIGNMSFRYSCTNDKDGCCISNEDNICDKDCAENIDPDCDKTLDKDDDGMPDEWESLHGLNPSYYYDYDEDPDQDGLTNFREYNLTLIYLNSTDPNNEDTDGDGYSDGEEINKKTNPLNIEDFPIPSEDDLSKDTDKDGLPDLKEEECGLNFKDPLDAAKDYDGDGLNNKEECTRGFNIQKADSDGDGFDDFEEFQKGTDPLSRDDKPEGSIISLFFYIIPVILIIGGVVFFFLKKTKKPSSKKSSTPKNINKKKRSEPVKKAGFIERKLMHKKPEPKPVKKETRPDQGHAIFKRRHLLKNRKRNRIFDEFLEKPDLKKQKIIKPKKRIIKQPVKKQQVSVFDRLNELVTQNKTFLKLDVLLKKKPETISRLNDLHEKYINKKQAILKKLESIINKDEL